MASKPKKSATKKSATKKSATKKSATKKSATRAKPTAADLAVVEATRPVELRRWLAAHHDSAAGVWVVFYKKHHPDHTDVRALVDEALCFGWIDSTLRRVDDDRTMLRFSPRKPSGHWAASNKRAVTRLERAGRMTAAGRLAVEAAKKSGMWTFLDDVERCVVPADLAAALGADARARREFDALTKSARRGLLYWVKSAKTDATRKKRIAELVREAAQGNVAYPR